MIAQLDLTSIIWKSSFVSGVVFENSLKVAKAFREYKNTTAKRVTSLEHLDLS